MIYRFGVYSIDSELRELCCEGEIREIQPKVLDLLVYLIRERERVVSRQELLDALWGDAAVIEGVLSTAVHAARVALGDSATRQWAVKTVARHGYRFVADMWEANEGRERARLRASVGVGASVGAGMGAGMGAGVEGVRSEAGRESNTERGARAIGPGSEIWGDATFVGRSDPLARLDSAAVSAAGGAGRVAVITGEAGIGKTRLLDEFAARASRDGWQVLTAWCYEGEGSPPYWAWAQVLRVAFAAGCPEEALLDMGAGAADLVALLPVLHELRPDLPEPPRLQSGPARFRLFESIASFLTNRAKRQPLLVTIDDLHSADHASLRLVSFLAREVKHARILVVATLREGENMDDWVLRETLAEVARQAPGERMRLSGLSEDESRQLVDRLGHRALPEPFVAAVAARGEGNPFFIKEIVNLLDTPGGREEERDLEAWKASVPPGVRDVILRRVRQRSEGCRRALAIAAVLGREFQRAALERMLGPERMLHVAVRDLEAALDEACAAGFLREHPTRVGHYRFAHGLVQETLYSEWGAAERTAWHRRAGEALEALMASLPSIAAEELAHHFLQAAADGNAEKAIEYAVRAAQKAAAVYAHDEAARHYERALAALRSRATPDDARCGELLISLGTAQLDANRSDARGRKSLLRAARIARQLGRPEMLARAATQLAGVSHYSGPGDLVVIELLEEALAGLGEEDGVLRARLLSDLAIQRLSSETLAKGTSLSDEAVALARKAADSALIGRTVNIQCAMLSAPEQIQERLRQAEELLALARSSGDCEIAFSGHRWRLACMLEFGEIEAMEAELEACEQLARKTRDHETRWYALAVRGAHAFFSGDLERAERCILDAYLQAHHEPNPFNIYTSDTQLRWLRKEQGRLDEVEGESEPDGPRTRFVALSAFRATRALMEAERGSFDRAHEELQRFANEGIAELPKDFTYLYSLAVLGEVCVTLADERAAPLIYDALLPYARRHVVRLIGAVCLGSVSRYLGQLATALGHWERAEEHFAAAIEDNERLRAPLWIAYTQLDRARMLVARGGGDGVTRALEEVAACLATAQRLGLRALARKAQALADRIRG